MYINYPLSIRNPTQIPKGLLSRYRLARVAFASCFHSSVFVGSFALEVVRNFFTRSLGRLSRLGFLLRHSELVDGQPGPWIKADYHPLFLLVDTAIEDPRFSCARQE